MAKGSNAYRARRQAQQRAKQAEARMARERQADPQEGSEVGEPCQPVGGGDRSAAAAPLGRGP